MAAYRTPGPIGKYLLPLSSADNGRPSRVSSPLSLQTPYRISRPDTLVQASDAQPGAVSASRYAELDAAVINASYFDDAAHAEVGRGATPMAIVLLQAGTPLYRIGSTKELPRGSPKIIDDGEREKHLVDKPLEANYTSPWWLRRQELDRILAKGQQDTSWAGRVMGAIARVWGSKCDLQISVTTSCALYAWVSEPKVINVLGNSVSDTAPDAYWIPEKDLMQLYIPGIGHTQLWRHVFTEVSATPWLWAGTQVNLATGQPFSPAVNKEKTMPPGKR